MKNKIIFGMMALCSLSFSAKLKYTQEKTPSYKGNIIKYSTYSQKGYPVVNLMYDSSTGMSRPENWQRELGVDVSKLKLFRAGNPEGEKKYYSADVDHFFAMLVAFDTEMGGNYLKSNLGSVALMSTILPSNSPSGIVSISAYSPAGSTGFMTSGSVYFGDVINELAGGYHQSPRLTGVTSNNTNLWISTFGNDDSIEAKNDMGGDGVSAAAPSQETFYFPMFGEEVQKISRSDSLRVKDFVCTGKANPMKTLSDVRGIDGPRQKNLPQAPCAYNDGNAADDYPFYALYARTHTIVGDGQVYAAGKSRTGSSFAVPRISALVRKIMMKFPGISYLQAKDIILTTASRENEELSSHSGWGIANHDKALRGPSALNAGLLEEQKFYTGMYDKVFDLKGNVYFWAEPSSDWTWGNDIYGNLPKHPEGNIVLNTVVNTKDRDGDIVQARLAFKTVKDLTFKRYIPSERNYYNDTAVLNPGLRKAGNKTLTINGNIYYNGPTEALAGKLVLNGNVPSSTIVVYEGAEVTVNGRASRVIIAGGKLRVGPNAVVDQVEIDPSVESELTFSLEGKPRIGTVISSRAMLDSVREVTRGKNIAISSEKVVNNFKMPDVSVNDRKFQDLKREYFMSGFADHIIKAGSNENILPALVRRYRPLSKAPREMLETVPGYSNGSFRLDGYQMAENQEFTRYTNPLFVNDSFKIPHSSWEWTDFYSARRKAGIE